MLPARALDTGGQLVNERAQFALTLVECAQIRGIGFFHTHRLAGL
jgi:hypothetical protein